MAGFLLVLLAALAWVGLRLAGRRPPLAPAARSLLVYVARLLPDLGASPSTTTGTPPFWKFLAPLVLVVLAERRILGVHSRLACAAATTLLLLTTSVGSWGRLEWGERWFNVRLPPQAYERDSLVLLDSPLSSFLVPYFPRETRFAGLEGTGSRPLRRAARRPASRRIAAACSGWCRAAGPMESTSPARFGLVVTDDCGLDSHRRGEVGALPPAAPGRAADLISPRAAG